MSNRRSTDTARLVCALEIYSTLGGKARVLGAFFGGDIRNRTGPPAGWAENTLVDAAKQLKHVTEDDGEALVNVAMCLRDDQLLQTL